MSKTPNSVPDLDPALNMRVQQFYFHEAQMLDDKRFRDWLAMFDKSATYRVPIRRTMPPRERKVEFSSEHDLSIFDENYRDLEQRIEKLETGKRFSRKSSSPCAAPGSTRMTWNSLFESTARFFRQSATATATPRKGLRAPILDAFARSSNSLSKNNWRAPPESPESG
jgi:hypothetical protein